LAVVLGAILGGYLLKSGTQARKVCSYGLVLMSTWMFAYYWWLQAYTAATEVPPGNGPPGGLTAAPFNPTTTGNLLTTANPAANPPVTGTPDLAATNPDKDAVAEAWFYTHFWLGALSNLGLGLALTGQLAYIGTGYNIS